MYPLPQSLVQHYALYAQLRWWPWLSFFSFDFTTAGIIVPDRSFKLAPRSFGFRYTIKERSPPSLSFLAIFCFISFHVWKFALVRQGSVDHTCDTTQALDLLHSTHPLSERRFVVALSVVWVVMCPDLTCCSRPFLLAVSISSLNVIFISFADCCE